MNSTTSCSGRMQIQTLYQDFETQVVNNLIDAGEEWHTPLVLEKNPKWQDLTHQVSEVGRKVIREVAEALAQGKAFTAYAKMQELRKEIKLSDVEDPNQLVA